MTLASDSGRDSAAGRVPIAFPGGKLPAQPARRQLRGDGFLDSTALPAPPDRVDWMSGIRSWPMYGNDAWGDCVFAGLGHHEQQISMLGQGAEVRVELADVLGGYSAVTGFNQNAGPPGDNPTDQGTYVIDAMSWWRKTGIAGHRILAYASLDPSNLTLIKQAIALFGTVGIGFNFPASAMSQFNQGKPWDVVSGSPIEGGHYVTAGAYDPTYIKTVTWAAEQLMTYAFWRKYVDEVWVPIDDEMVSTLTGKSFTGVDLRAFATQFTELTGETVPISDGPPPPSPADAATPADRTLRHGVEGWARTVSPFYKGTRKNILDWIAAKKW